MAAAVAVATGTGGGGIGGGRRGCGEGVERREDIFREINRSAI